MMLKKNAEIGTRIAIYAAYLAPFVIWGTMAILFSSSRMFFTYLGQEHETMSMFSLLSNTWDTCQAALDANTITPGAIAFARIMSVFTVLFWIGFVWFTILAFHSLFCPLIAFSYQPTSTAANRTKQIFAFAYCNRAVYVIFQALPILLSLFPYLLLSFYESKMAIKMTVSFQGIPDVLLLLLLTTLSVFLFLFTAQAQREAHIDMFRLYKKRKSEDEP